MVISNVPILEKNLIFTVNFFFTLQKYGNLKKKTLLRTHLLLESAIDGVSNYICKTYHNIKSYIALSSLNIKGKLHYFRDYWKHIGISIK